MNITFKRSNDVPYIDTDIGDVIVCGGYVYIVTDQPEEDGDGMGNYKAVNLANGNMATIGRKTMVTRFDNATLTLE